MIWFYPSFRSDEKMNKVKTFLQLIYQNFPASSKQNTFNYNTVKVSFSCKENISHIQGPMQQEKYSGKRSATTRMYLLCRNRMPT